MGFVFVACFVAQSSFGQDSNVVGTWKLVSNDVVSQATGEKSPVMGENPTGYASFTADGRVYFVLTAEGRKPATTDQERAQLLKTVVAYTGTYRVEEDKWTVKVDAAWNPEWVGTEQVRSFKIDRGRLQVVTPWRIQPNWADKGVTRNMLTFERSK
jgi:hypothetical protein